MTHDKIFTLSHRATTMLSLITFQIITLQMLNFISQIPSNLILQKLFFLRASSLFTVILSVQIFSVLQGSKFVNLIPEKLWIKMQSRNNQFSHYFAERVKRVKHDSKGVSDGFPQILWIKQIHQIWT